MMRPMPTLRAFILYVLGATLWIIVIVLSGIAVFGERNDGAIHFTTLRFVGWMLWVTILTDVVAGILEGVVCKMEFERLRG